MSTQAIRAPRMHVIHALAVGAAVAGFFFILLWASEAAGVSPFPPQFTEMFRPTPDQNLWTPLLQGIPAALSVGAAGGAAIAVFANMFRFLDTRT